MLRQRARQNQRSLSAEVRELLTYARNTMTPGVVISTPTYQDSPSTSVSLTPRLKAWLNSQALYNDRTLQVELLMLVVFALEDIMERDLALIEQWSAADPAAPAPECAGTAAPQPGS